MESATTAEGDSSRFTSRPDDIYIASYPRSGTTWLQMILYQLTTNGDMSFFHISQFIPYFERALITNRDLDELPSPRIFKTHQPYKVTASRPGKYIYVARKGKDVLASYFHFYRSHLGFSGTFQEFFDKFMAGHVQFGSWFQHVADWRAHAGDANVLFLNYEELVVSFDDVLARIIAFCEFEIPESRYPEIKERCSFAFMRQHESKFDHTTELAWELLQSRSSGAFLRKGGTDSGKELLTNEQNAKFDEHARWWGES